jgi:hypothetical protein
VRIRLERLRVEAAGKPMSWPTFLGYYRWYDDHPDEDRDPIEVEECGSDRHGRLYVIRDGKYRFMGAMLAGRKDLLAYYKGEKWAPSNAGSASTWPVVDLSQSASSD